MDSNEKFGVELVLVAEKFKQKMEQIKGNIQNFAQTTKNSLKTTLTADTSQLDANLDYAKSQIADLLNKNNVNFDFDFNDNGELITASQNAQAFREAIYNMSVESQQYLSELREDVVELTQNINRIETGPFAKLNSYLRQTKKNFNTIKNEPKKFDNNLKKSLESGIKNIKRFTMSLFGIQSAWRMVSRASSAYMSQDAELSNKMSAVWIGLGSILAPVLEKLANLFILLVSYANAFSKAFFGYDFLAIAMEKANKKMNETSKTMNKLQGQLSGIDEITNIDINGGDNESPDLSWMDAFKDVKIDTKFIDKIKTKFDKMIKEIKKGVKKIWNWEPLAKYRDKCFGYLKEIYDNVSQLGINIFNDVSASSSKWAEPIKTSVNNLFNDIYNDIWLPWTDILGTAWSDFTGLLLEKWDKYGGGLTDKLGESFNTLMKYWNDIYNNIIKPIAEPLIENLRWLWDEHLSGMIDKFLDFVFNLADGIMTLWNKVIQPFLSKLTDIFAPVWSFVCSFVIGILGTLSACISDTFGGILEIFDGLIDFIVGIFTGDWERAWKGVKKIFKGIWDSLVGIAKVPINLIIDLVNGLIAGINKISIKVPNWGIFGDMKGEKLGFNIKPLAKLDVGTNYVPNDQLALIHQGEAVIPKKFNSQEYFGNGNEETNSLLREVLEKIDNIEINPYTTIKDVGEASTRYITSRSRIMGRGVI